MKKIYKLSGFGLTILTPMALIACSSTPVEPSNEITTYYSAPVVAEGSATVTFKSLGNYKGKMLAVLVAKTKTTNWSSPQKEAISESNKDSLTMEFTSLDKGQAYDMKIVIMEPGSTTQIIKDIGTKVSAFSTTSDTVTPPVVNPPVVTPIEPDVKEPEKNPIPTDKEVKSFVEILGPIKAEVTVRDLGKYVDKTVVLKYKEVKDLTKLVLDDYFWLSARKATEATLTFSAEYLEIYKGKKIKIEYRKANATATTDVDRGAYSTPKMVMIPENIGTIGDISTTLMDLETSQYDLKITIVDSANENMLIKALGEKLSAFETSAEAAPEVVKREKTSEFVVSKTNYELIKFVIDELKLKTKYTYTLVAEKKETVDTVEKTVEETILPYSNDNIFDTTNTTKIDFGFTLNNVSVKLSNLLKKYSGATLNFSIFKDEAANKTQVYTAQGLVENSKASVIFPRLEAGNYTLRLFYISGDQAGKNIDLEGVEPANLKFVVPALTKVIPTPKIGANAITIELADATSYKGQNLTLIYAPTDSGTTDEERLVSIYANSVTSTVDETGKVSFQMQNLEKASADKKEKRFYTYKIVLESTDAYVTTNATYTVQTSPFATVKLNVTTPGVDKTITYAGSSAKVTITDLEEYKGKTLEIKAVLNPKTGVEYLSNFFPSTTEEQNKVRTSEAILVPSTGSSFDKEFKILNLDSEQWYVFQLFIQGEQNPLLYKGFDFKANVTPNTSETLSAKNSVNVKVSKLGNAIGGKIQLKWASTLAELNGTDDSKITAIAEQEITEDNKDNLTFTVPGITGTSFAYKLEIKPSGETAFSDAKELIVKLPTTTAEGMVSGMKVTLKDGQLIQGKELILKYKLSSATDYTTSSGSSTVGVDGVATFEQLNLEAGEEYDYQVWTKNDLVFEVLNGAAATLKVTTLSNPIAEVTYNQTDRTKVDITIKPLYNYVGTTLILNYREAVLAAEKVNPWKTLETELLVGDIDKVNGVTFNLTNLIAEKKYEFQILDKATNKPIATTASFQSVAPLAAPAP